MGRTSVLTTWRWRYCARSPMRSTLGRRTFVLVTLRSEEQAPDVVVALRKCLNESSSLSRSSAAATQAG
jgi:hypothetical protein